MTLLEDLNKLKSQWRPLPFSLPTVSLTERLHADIEAHPLRPPKPPVDLRVVHNKLLTAKAGGNWGAIQPVEWRYASECLALGQPPLFHDEQFIGAYLSAIRHYTSGGAIRRLARFYLTHFDRKTPGIARIAAYLRENVNDCGIWAARHAKFKLFVPDEAPHELASAATAEGNDPRKFLDGVGFTGNLAGSGMTAEVFRLACRSLQRTLEDPNSARRAKSEIERIWNWASPDGKTFLYGGHPRARAALADAVLMPWVKQAPPDELRELITANLLSLFRDPRIRESAWVGVQPDAKTVFYRWLTKASLEQFLAFVDDIVQPEHRHMWEARRKFWRAYYDQHFMEEAWVVFGSRGAQFVSRLAARGEPIGFGTFKTGTGDPTQCVLIMRIGSLVIADWSHNGACHIWRATKTAAPRLYEPSYSRDALKTGSDMRQAHLGSWQHSIANFIRDETNARATRYM